MPSPGSSFVRPSRPRARCRGLSATTQREHRVEPSARMRENSTSVAEQVEDREDGRTEDNDEKRGEDEEDEREQHLDRRLLSSLLRRGAPLLPHLDREVAHDLPDR